MNVIYLTEEEFQNSKARMAETDKIDGYLKLIQPLYEAVRKFQPDALLLYCVSPSVENPCFYRLHVGLIREVLRLSCTKVTRTRNVISRSRPPCFPKPKAASCTD